MRIDQFWFTPGQVESGAFLWESARWLLRKRGTMLMTFFDPRGPMQGAIILPRFMPPQGGSIMLSAPVPPRQERLVYFQA